MALSSLRFSNGSTAILFSGTKVAGLLDWITAPRRKKIENVTAKVTADKSTTTTRTHCGQRGVPTGRTGADICFHLIPRFNFCGKFGLPRLSLARLKI